MIQKNLKSISGLTLIEILIGIVVSSIMMAAIYTTYSIVNNTYGQVLEKAKVCKSSRDLIEVLIRDIRMSGFKYFLGIVTNLLKIEKLEKDLIALENALKIGFSLN